MANLRRQVGQTRAGGVCRLSCTVVPQASRPVKDACLKVARDLQVAQACHMMRSAVSDNAVRSQGSRDASLAQLSCPSLTYHQGKKAARRPRLSTFAGGAGRSAPRQLPLAHQYCASCTSRLMGLRHQLSRNLCPSTWACSSSRTPERLPTTRHDASAAVHSVSSLCNTGSACLAAMPADRAEAPDLVQRRGARPDDVRVDGAASHSGASAVRAADAGACFHIVWHCMQLHQRCRSHAQMLAGPEAAL